MSKIRLKNKLGVEFGEMRFKRSHAKQKINVQNIFQFFPILACILLRKGVQFLELKILH